MYVRLLTICNEGVYILCLMLLRDVRCRLTVKLQPYTKVKCRRHVAMLLLYRACKKAEVRLILESSACSAKV
jgi:hypothetical protein